MTVQKRPISPHLQVYRLPLTGLISISHRITGVLLSIGLLGFIYLLICLAGGETSYQDMQTFMAQGLMQFIFFGFIFSLYFHLCHGIRHLIWDSGATFDKASLLKYAQFELAAATLLTILTFLIL